MERKKSWLSCAVVFPVGGCKPADTKNVDNIHFCARKIFLDAGMYVPPLRDWLECFFDRPGERPMWTSCLSPSFPLDAFPSHWCVDALPRKCLLLL